MSKFMYVPELIQCPKCGYYNKAFYVKNSGICKFCGTKIMSKTDFKNKMEKLLKMKEE